jgi:signal transduction histidine kinase
MPRKWSAGHVKVSATASSDGAEAGRSWLLITVDDDGPGLPADKRADAMKRGRRLDETKPGSGLGLSIVAETAAMYGGGVKLGDADLGGLRVELKLPAVA